ncbi:DUF1538 domain-containing protein [Alginatibacterium sediminis]|uniref:DUF1538 domain-containing protein n=1 Tax=Alginatibacterium sediminis TaxID=2164068 RepID=A0A420EA01_9ALTE|nr:DUF1538 domain-containing protein [Alginatibacterium sediminis]RKF17499.1 DUF1538 domain-containing protein [Alginatibacterium sediminis]
MVNALIVFLHSVLKSLRDLLPIAVVVLFFQTLVLRQPLPDSSTIALGMFLVVLGLSLFIVGLDMALFPLGEKLAYDFARRGRLSWLLSFAFCLGFATTVAEPSLIAISRQAAEIAAIENFIDSNVVAKTNYALQLRLVVAVSVGCALVIGVIRILRGWPLHWIILSGYLVVVILSYFSAPEHIGIAYDAGGVTTSTITVPLVTALGVGLAASIHGRSPLVDGFGLIALASLSPMIFVLAFGMIN